MNMIQEKIHNRHSIRLKGYGYSQVGAYFLTICSHNRECVFGDIVDTKMQLDAWGVIAKNEWLKTSQIRNNVIIDEFILMPNHIHGIIIITGRGVLQYAPTKFKSPSQTIGAIIRGYKSITTTQINELRHAQGEPVWQRNYYEHIIRNEDELTRIREYIMNNPLQWQFDRENFSNVDDEDYKKQWGKLEEYIYGKK